MADKKALYAWVEEFPSAVTVSDAEGRIVAMNRASLENFSKQGGERLIGTSLFDCHSERSNKIIKKMLQKETGQTYITESKGKKRLVHQLPWYDKGTFAGLVELIVDLPGDISVRKRS